MEMLSSIMEQLQTGRVGKETSAVKVYEQSYTKHDNVYLLMVKVESDKFILASGNGPLYDALTGEDVGENGKACPLTHENRLVLNRYFDYTVPRAFGTKVATMGLGDRLGLASPGHIETIRHRDVKPVLAQQSIRELNLTNRSMNDVLDAAAFAVFQEGYKGGYGADGDHIKKESDIKYALSLGVSMITLDCSDQIDKSIEEATAETVKQEYHKLPKDVKEYYSEKYLDKTFKINGLSLTFNEIDLMRNVLLYNEAITYTAHVYHEYISKEDRAIDFEISIDETETITSPVSHFFVANELIQKQVGVVSLAPRFCGEFQKGIDYIGDLEQFEHELSEHALIAEHFGYKLSIHSGSDKFKVFPTIAKYTKGILHIKTAGTNWLEAIRVIAKVNPSLYRTMHRFALEHFEETLKYYHVTPDLKSIKSLDDVPDEDLSDYMNDDAARQLFHVTFGLILSNKDDNGHFTMKDDIFQTLSDYEETYTESLITHIGKHLDKLGL
ncbi:tagaturonate epimerase family protein [Virgibacillus sp. NKC19-3]|uniref:tagaturonate epimerase family protein n=1 Tax=Virgibacillus saliphilus TaxID=2831674 RepID=UPI001C9B821A|nr:tagaturonate epimerase family protein [Virgibacillus sp. NKC19-3]MBY7142292.1 tagaturonate epimerase family protein [Virgibacillus sp. NKC19-3]